MFALSWSFGSFIGVVWSLFGTAILAGIAGLIAKGLDLMHIHLDIAAQDQLVSVVTDAIHYAEEQDAAGRKSGAGFSSKAKASIALKYVLDRELANVTPEHIAQVIQAILPQVGLGATER